MLIPTRRSPALQAIGIRLASRTLAASLTLSLVFGSGAIPAAAAASDSVNIRGGVAVGVRGDDVIPSLSLRDAQIKDVLYTISEQAGFNLIVDESVEGTISLDLKGVSFNKLMEYVLTLADLTYYKDGKTMIVTSKDKADEKSLNKLVLKSIPVRYSNAADLASVLSNTVFSANRPGGNANAVATADPRTNSILIMGNESDIDLAQRALAQLDFPLQHKTFFLKNAPAREVANTIAQTLFSVSLTSVGAAGGSSASGGGASTTTAASSAGAASSTPSGSSSSGSSNTGGSSGASSGGTGATGGVEVLKGGPVTFIANAINNTLTLIGTAEQIQLAESMLYDVDVKSAQVAIQVSVLELNYAKNKTLNPSINSATDNNISLLSRNMGLNFLGDTTSIFYDGDGVPNVNKILPSVSRFGISSQFTETKGRVLSNPTVMAVSGSTSTINFTNDVFAGNSTARDATTGLVTVTPIIKQVGITLQITPEVFNDGTVSLNMTPTVSSPSGTAQDGAGNLITLISSNTLNIARSRVKDGQTLVLGGIIREGATTSWRRIPFLSDLPILGAMFRAASSNNDTRSELVILVTPHIIKEEGVPYFRKGWQERMSYTQQGGSAASTAEKPGPANERATFIPASRTQSERQQPQGFQSLERRPEKGDASGKTATQSANLPLKTFTEVLK